MGTVGAGWVLGAGEWVLGAEEWVSKCCPLIGYYYDTINLKSRDVRLGHMHQSRARLFYQMQGLPQIIINPTNILQMPIGIIAPLFHNFTLFSTDVFATDICIICHLHVFVPYFFFFFLYNLFMSVFICHCLKLQMIAIIENIYF